MKKKVNELLKKENYNLGKIGREKINKRIYKKGLWTKYDTLIPEDLLGSTNYLINLKYGFGF